jgi:DNA-binding response OmpR family regulator
MIGGKQDGFIDADGTEPPRVRIGSIQSQHGPSILIIADDPDFGDWLLDEFRHAGSAVALATSGKEVLELLRSGLVDIVISEMGLPDLPGMDLLRELQSMPKMPKVILTAGHQLDFLDSRAIENGASAVLCKPFRIEQLFALIAQALGN